MTLIIASLIVSALALVFVGFWIVIRRHKKNGKELAIVAEIPETCIFGAALVALGFVMLIGKLTGMPIGGQDAQSYPFTAAFGAILVFAGCEILLWSFVKRTIAYKDKLVAYNSFGNGREIPWSAVTAVKVPYLSRRATFKSDECSISVNGRRDDYIKLVVLASKKVPPIVASDDLGRLLRRLAR